MYCNVLHQLAACTDVHCYKLQCCSRRANERRVEKLDLCDCYCLEPMAMIVTNYADPNLAFLSHTRRRQSLQSETKHGFVCGSSQLPPSPPRLWPNLIRFRPLLLPSSWTASATYRHSGCGRIPPLHARFCRFFFFFFLLLYLLALVFLFDTRRGFDIRGGFARTVLGLSGTCTILLGSSRLTPIFFPPVRF